MKKIILITFFTFSASQLLASEVYDCTSVQTSYSYVFDVENGTVKVSDAKNEFSAYAEVTYEPGMGDDILYVIKQGDIEYGLINGEEGLRANFSHSMFESGLEESGMECVISENVGN